MDFRKYSHGLQLHWKIGICRKTADFSADFSTDFSADLTTYFQSNVQLFLQFQFLQIRPCKDILIHSTVCVSISLTYRHEGGYIITLTKSHIEVSLQINIRLHTKNISAFAFNKLDICGMHDWSLILRRHHKCKLQIQNQIDHNSIRFPFHRSKRFATEENRNIIG